MCCSVLRLSRRLTRLVNERRRRRRRQLSPFLFVPSLPATPIKFSAASLQRILPLFLAAVQPSPPCHRPSVRGRPERGRPGIPDSVLPGRWLPLTLTPLPTTCRHFYRRNLTPSLAASGEGCAVVAVLPPRPLTQRPVCLHGPTLTLRPLLTPAQFSLSGMNRDVPSILVLIIFMAAWVWHVAMGFRGLLIIMQPFSHAHG